MSAIGDEPPAETLENSADFITASSVSAQPLANSEDADQKQITIASIISMPEAARLVFEAQNKLSEASAILDQARTAASKWGLSVDSSILDSSYQSGFLPARFRHGLVHESTLINEDPSADQINLNKSCAVLSTTGGHSNTNHVILSTGNPFADKLAEYKRIYKRRAKAMQPEQRGMDRWDQPRVQGSRRRRITREVDLPSAPAEPPSSGYVS